MNTDENKMRGEQKKIVNNFINTAAVELLFER